MKFILPAVVVIIVIAVLIFFYVIRGSKQTDGIAQKLIDSVMVTIEPLEKEINLASWEATTTGNKDAYKRIEEKQNEYNKFLSDPLVYKELKGLKDAKYRDPLVKRQIETLYYMYLSNQIPEDLNREITAKEVAITEKFNSFRSTVNGKQVTDNDIKKVLADSADAEEKRVFWEGSKQVGAEVAKDLLEIVKLRNKAAKILGFDNYYVMQLELQEYTEDELFGYLKDLDEATKKPFARLKDEIDTFLAKKFNIGKSELRPWHYEDPFFQTPPQIYSLDMDQYYKGKDVVDIAKRYYDGKDLKVDETLARSSLYEKPGKEQHAYCIDIDKKGDIRVLANVIDNEEWASVMFHELGHAVYNEYVNPALPFLLRNSAHTFTTEGIAQTFEKLTYSPEWLTLMVDPAKKEEFFAARDKLEKLLEANLLIFARWVLVMSNFERDLYRNPEMNLNEHWWELVEKYQGVHGPYGRNNPDWAAKIHFTTAPVYYHNYIMGEIFGAQLRHAIAKNDSVAGNVLLDDPKLGSYLKEKVFAPGDSMRWNEFVKFATGEELTLKYFKEQFEQ